MRRRLKSSLAPLLLLLALAGACSNSGTPPTPTAGSGDAVFRQLATEILEYTYRQDPSTATRLGILVTNTPGVLDGATADLTLDQS